MISLCPNHVETNPKAASFDKLDVVSLVAAKCYIYVWIQMKLFICLYVLLMWMYVHFLEIKYQSINQGTEIKECFVQACAQRSHDMIISSLIRQNDVVTSFWHNDDVIITVCVRWARVFILNGPKSLFCRIRPASAPDGRCGIFVKVDTLRDGQCFVSNGYIIMVTSHGR